MHNKSLANNPQKLPTVSLKLGTFFSTARNDHCNASVLAEKPLPVLPHNELPTFLLNRCWKNLGGNPVILS